jgi:hypothetical protein
LRARSTALLSTSDSNGFTMYLKAPYSTASVALSIAGKPVTSTTGKSASCARMVRSSSTPVISGIEMSLTTTCTPPADTRSTAARAEVNDSTG